MGGAVGFDMNGTDWEEGWRRLQRRTTISRDVEFWNRHAPRFVDKKDSNYYFDFRDLADIREGETLFDMGCGSGTFAIPYADEGHEVFAADFSPVMLDLMMEEARLRGIERRVHPVLAAWEDDWEAMGVPKCDVAIASRSMNAHDLKGALEKLDGIARRRVCITLPGGTCLKADARIMKRIGVPVAMLPDYVYAQYFLLEMGVCADVKLFGTPKLDVYDSIEEAYDKNIDRIGGLTERQKEMVREHLDEHLVEHTTDEGDKKYAKDYTRDVRWAFLTWEKQNRSDEDSGKDYSREDFRLP
jgi:SAM-dependent methyltransferase